MNHIKLTPLYKEIVNGDHKKEPDIVIDLSSDLILTPDILKKYNGNLKLSDLYGFNAYISCTKKITIIIKGFNYFTLMTYTDSDATLSYLKIYDVSDFCRLNNLEIRRLDIENSQILSVDCKINELNFGIESYNNYIEKNYNNSKHPDIDMRHSIVDKASIYRETEIILIKESRISKLELKGDIKKINISEYSEIQYLLFTNLVNEFKLSNSKIDNINGTKSFILKNFIREYSTIENCHNIYDNNVKSKNLESFEILRESYKNDKNIAKYSDYSYRINYILFKKEKRKGVKIGMWFLKVTCGFGYKVFKAILFCILTISIFAVFYFLIQLFGGHDYGFEIAKNKTLSKKILFSFYHSIVTFATLGYGDTIIIDWYTRFLSGLESLIGIFSMSIIIYTLTNKIIKK